MLPVTVKTGPPQGARRRGARRKWLGTPLLAHATDEGEELVAAQAALETTVPE